ncbi:MAG: hypothetical protein ACYDAC_07280 [Candidatus Dormibacteria bacterium]
MATFVRNRVINQLAWADEEEEVRAERRDILCELDGLLTQLEEVNLRGGPVPPRVLVALRRRGVLARPGITAPELIEAIFSAQEAFMRQPQGAAAGTSLLELQRRIA